MKIDFEVEPLSEARWSEIRRAVLERADERPLEPVRSASMPPPARARLMRWQIATGVALAAACALAWLATRPTTESLATSHVVTVGSGATVSAGDVTVEVEPFSSILLLRQGDDEWLAAIEQGGARFLVPPRGDRPSFRVAAGQTNVTVIGTRFVVERGVGAPSGTVFVEHGAVRVTERGEEVVLHDGDRWPVAVVAAAATPPPTTLAMPAEPIATVEALAPHDDASDERPPRRAPRVAIETDESTAAVVRIQTPSSEPALVEPWIDTTPTLPLVEPTVAPPPTDAHARFTEASALEATDASRALAIYLALTGEGGPWGTTALFAAGRLEADRHHDAYARSLLQRYLAQSPDGMNAPDARRLLQNL